MLNQFLMISLVISIVGYGSVWTFDTHLEQVDGHRPIVSDTGYASDGDDNHPAVTHQPI
jgi:hypothetical protein